MRSGLYLVSIGLLLLADAAPAQMKPANSVSAEEATAALVERLRLRAAQNKRTIADLRETLRVLQATRISVPSTPMIAPAAAFGAMSAPLTELQRLRDRVSGQQDLIARLRKRIALLERMPKR